MNITQSKAMGLLAAGTLLATLAHAQGNPAQDLATAGGISQIKLQPGASRGSAEGANVIYNNGPFINAPGGGAGGLDASVLQSTSRSHNIIGYGLAGASASTVVVRVADDFTVPAGQMWYVDSLKVWCYRTGSVGLVFDDAVCQVWDANPAAGPANVVFGNTTTNRIRSSTFDNAYRVTETTLAANNRELHEVEINVGHLFKPGTYWIEWGVNQLATPAANTFAPPVTINGVDNTGNGIQFITSAWGPLLMNGPGGVNAHPQDMPFVLCGVKACCWEPGLGTDLGHGDDSVTTNLALGFNFPMPGALPGGATTNLVSVASNGYVSLDNAATSDFTPSVAEFTSLNPRIAVPWDDYYTPGGGSVWFSAASPYHAVATWLRIDTFSGGTTQSMLQLQMFKNGTFTINCWRHEPVTPRTPVFGVSAGASAPSVAINASAGHVGVPGVATIYESFVSGASDLSGNFFCFRPINDGVAASYNVEVSPACCTFASSAVIGPGCFGMTSAVTRELILGGVGATQTTLLPGTLGQVTLIGIASPNLFDLAPLGAPTCFVHHTNNLFSVPMDGAGLTVIPLPCLQVLAGLPLGVQGVAIVPGLNALGVAVGDGLQMNPGNN